jgi:hemerythrin
MTALHISHPLIDRRHMLGHDVIDSEHAAISNCWFYAVNCPPIEFPLRLARLKKLMAMHFEHESALLAQSGYALCRYHHNEHRMLLELCDQVMTSHERDWKKAQSLLQKKFAKLVREHVITMDQCAVLLIHSNSEIAAAPNQ